MTETMIYVLMALQDRDMFGKEIVDWVAEKTNRRVVLGPGTLYTILAKFESDGYIYETNREGRARTYTMTTRGTSALHNAIDNYKQIILDAQEVLKEN